MKHQINKNRYKQFFKNNTLFVLAENCVFCFSKSELKIGMKLGMTIHMFTCHVFIIFSSRDKIDEINKCNNMSSSSLAWRNEMKFQNKILSKRGKS